MDNKQNTGQQKQLSNYESNYESKMPPFEEKNFEENKIENSIPPFLSLPKILTDEELVKNAYSELFENKPFNYRIKVSYNNKFSDYNANIKYSHFHKYLDLRLSKKWIGVSHEIRIGLIQSLMQKIFKTKKDTDNIDLYNKFLKNVHISAPKTKTDTILEESFKRVNEKYFYGLIEQPNLKWSNGSRVLGKYEYGSDTINISNILEQDFELVDYVMYHEILHKKHKFESKHGRTKHHTTQFRQAEKSYPDSEMLEKRLNRFSNKNRLINKITGTRKRSWKFW